MEISLPYGKGSLTVTLPDSARVITGQRVKPLTDPDASLLKAFDHPDAGPSLEELVCPGDQIVISHSDITRATPNHIIIPALTAYLEKLGVPADNITLLNQTGTHRGQSDRELEEMLGREVVSRYRTVQHDAVDEKSLLFVGETDSGNRICLNRTWVEADARIATGFIEPHFFAGFSGGPKAVFPGVAALSGIMNNHDPRRVSSPAATWGITRGNPVWEEIAAAAELSMPHFIVNVTLTPEGEISRIFSGELFEAHRLGCNQAADQAMVTLPRSADVSVTSNSGYPLDQNLYQTVKGISAAASVTRPGGSIVIASACSDGIPSHGAFGDMLRRFPYPGDFLDFLSKNREGMPDLWQAAIFARLATRYKIFICSAGLREERLETSFFTLIEDMSETIDTLCRREGGEIAVLPEGPQVIATVTDRA